MAIERTTRTTVVRFTLLILILLGCWGLGHFFDMDTGDYQAWISRYPPGLAAAVFIVLYVGITFFAWLAKDAFKIVGAVLFGPYWSTLYIWLAEMANAAILFHLSRRLGRDFVARTVGFDSRGPEGRWASSGFWTIFAARSIPLVPYRFLDLFCGLTRISFAKYFLIVVIASPLRIFWIQFILAGVGEAVFTDPLKVMDYFSQNSFIFAWSLAYVIAAISLIVWWNKKKGGRE